MTIDIAVPAAVKHLEGFVNAGIFEPIDVHAAAAIARLMNIKDKNVVLGAALAVRTTREGHVCVMIDNADVGVEVTDGTKKLAWPSPDEWRASLTASPAVRVVTAGEVIDSQPGEIIVPLIFDGERLYLDRYYDYELRLAAAVLTRAGTTTDKQVDAGKIDTGKIEAGKIEAVLTSIYGAETVPPDLQRDAARRALAGNFTVIAGGPGTGKTHTIARLLAARIALDGDRPSAIALAAPTGKAAARMTEAIHQEMEALPTASTARGRLAQIKATTLHRLLSITPQHSASFNAANPLPCDLIVVDEASMVNLALMTQLFDALSPHSSIVLVGDPDQLASVEAGAVLGDIVAAATTSPTDPSPTDPSSIAAASDLGARTVKLTRNYRFEAGSGIAELADLVRLGETDAVLALLSEGRTDVAWIDPTDNNAAQKVEDEAVAAALKVVTEARAGNIDDAMRESVEHNVVCATRYGKFGVNYWTEKIQIELLKQIPDCDAGQAWYAGRPIMITVNDYLNNLFNGDTGLVVNDISSEDSSASELKVVFETNDGWRRLSPSQVGEHKTWWASTIHKTQGSEFDRVVVCLPEAPARVLSRELLYTGLTRARTQVSVVASSAALVTAINTPAVRASGLVGHLRR